jgi:hypothetical protein
MATAAQVFGRMWPELVEQIQGNVREWNDGGFDVPAPHIRIVLAEPRAWRLAQIEILHAGTNDRVPDDLAQRVWGSFVSTFPDTLWESPAVVSDDGSFKILCRPELVDDRHTLHVAFYRKRAHQ